MNYLIIENNIITNIIECENDEIATKFGAVKSYDGAMIGEEYVVPTSPASVLRETAYNIEKIIEWNGKLITVTEASQLWQYYAAEGSDKASELQGLIASAKAEIRERFPDEGGDEP